MSPEYIKGRRATWEMQHKIMWNWLQMKAWD